MYFCIYPCSHSHSLLCPCAMVPAPPLDDSCQQLYPPGYAWPAGLCFTAQPGMVSGPCPCVCGPKTMAPTPDHALTFFPHKTASSAIQCYPPGSLFFFVFASCSWHAVRCPNLAPCSLVPCALCPSLAQPGHAVQKAGGPERPLHPLRPRQPEICEDARNLHHPHNRTQGGIFGALFIAGTGLMLLISP